MDEKWKIVLFGTLGYVFVTFPLAILWHMVLFGGLYDTIGYIGREEPSFLLGFLSILLQGVLLSYGYSLFFGERKRKIIDGVKYGLFIGMFFWSSHVMAFAAKVALENIGMFFLMESVYLLLQFGIYGLVIGWIGKR